MLKLTLKLLQLLLILYLSIVGGSIILAHSTQPNILAFSSNRSGNFDIYLYDISHAVTFNLTKSPDSEIAPVWLPDRSGLTYRIGRSGEGYYRWDTHQATNYPYRLRMENPLPLISPDGRWLVSSRASRNANDLFLTDLHTGSVQHLTSDPGSELNPSWSPDGEWITYSAAFGQNTEIFILRVEDGVKRELRRITDNPAIDSGAVWMPRR